MKNWKGIRKLANMNVKKTFVFSISQLYLSGNINDDFTSIVNSFNNVFAKVWPNTRKKVFIINHLRKNKILLIPSQLFP